MWSGSPANKKRPDGAQGESGREPAVNYFEELNPESLAHILRRLEYKEVGMISTVCRKFNTALMGRNGAAGHTIFRILGQLIFSRVRDDRLFIPHRVTFFKAVESWSGFISHPDLTALTNLDLSDNQITDIKPLQDLSALWGLDLSLNQITDIKPLQDLSALTNLDLSDNQITDIKPLQDLTALTSLGLGQNKITDIKPLQDLTALTNLDLSDNQITDIKPLQDSTALRTLVLSDNQITDIKPLQDLTALRTLDLLRNQITDIKPLLHLAALRTLDLLLRVELGGNQIHANDPTVVELKSRVAIYIKIK